MFLNWKIKCFRRSQNPSWVADMVLSHGFIILILFIQPSSLFAAILTDEQYKFEQVMQCESPPTALTRLRLNAVYALDRRKEKTCIR